MTSSSDSIWTDCTRFLKLSATTAARSTASASCSWPPARPAACAALAPSADLLIAARAIQGIGEACRALYFPIVSGNVSLYNETDGQPILPTPTIGGVGLLETLDDLIAGLPRQGDVALVIGATRGHLGQSALAA